MAQSIEMYVALRTLGVETQLVTYPEEGHSIGEREHQLDLIRRVVGWFVRGISGRDARNVDQIVPATNDCG
ncbi:MAG: prolyl oligopeptidase family serine peptidase [Actinomycetota bacterium]|nr:prolyl oligopeptidase family serine peptidase [Actinomycetota bacterium]